MVRTGVTFESYSGGQVIAPKSGRVRAVPMAPDVARRWLA